MSVVDQPPPYPGYPPGTSPRQMAGVHPPQPVVVVTSSAHVPVIVGQRMGFKPSPYVCSSCSAQIVTRVEQRTTLRAHLFAFLFCAIGFWPCVCIPYCMESCRSADHYCPNCGSYIGSYIN